MFAKLLQTMAVFGLASFASAQQMPLPAASATATTSLAKSAPVPAPVMPATTAEASRPGLLPASQAASSASMPIAASPVPSARANQTALTGALSIQQVAEVQRQQLAAETSQKLGLVSSPPATVLPPAEFAKPYHAPKLYPKIEYVAGPVGDEKVGFRMPDGELLPLEVGNTIQQWQIKNVVSGKVYLELPAKRGAVKTSKKKKIMSPVNRILAVGQSLK